MPAADRIRIMHYCANHAQQTCLCACDLNGNGRRFRSNIGALALHWLPGQSRTCSYRQRSGDPNNRLRHGNAARSSGWKSRLGSWFDNRFAKRCRGKAFLVRYADDFVGCFEYEADARDFERELQQRLAQFALEVQPTKTALIRFGDLAPARCKRDGDRRPRTFNFLGFTHFIAPHRGRARLGRTTQRERVHSKLKALGARLKSLRTEGTRAMQTYIRAHLLGYIQYFGVSGNSRSLGNYVFQAGRLLYYWINRRSQRRSMSW